MRLRDAPIEFVVVGDAGSDRCGDVVEDGVSGLVLTGTTGAEDARVLECVLAAPQRLAAWSRAIASVAAGYSLERLADRMVALPDA